MLFIQNLYGSRGCWLGFASVTDTSTSAATIGCPSTSWLKSCLTSPCVPSPQSSSALLSTFWSVLLAPIYKWTIYRMTEVWSNAAWLFLLRSEEHSLSIFSLHADGDPGGLHRHGHDHGHFSWPERRGSRQHLHDHHLRLHDGKTRDTHTSRSGFLRLISDSDLQRWIPLASADFLGSPGQPAQHQGLAGLAQVLQHSSLRPRSKPRDRKGRITDLSVANKVQISQLNPDWTSWHESHNDTEIRPCLMCS